MLCKVAYYKLSGEEQKNAAGNFFRKYDPKKFAGKTSLMLVFRLKLEPMAKAWRPLKPYIITKRTVKLVKGRPTLLG